jgi:hypothetical protein
MSIRGYEATGEALVAKRRKALKKVIGITKKGNPMNSDRESERSILALKPGNAGGVKGPYY